MIKTKKKTKTKKQKIINKTKKYNDFSQEIEMTSHLFVILIHLLRILSIN